MVYDLIIIGAGAAGLFAGASLSSPINGLIIERGAKPGRKLLMSGAGQCNLTHGGSIKDFINHYGKNGSQIRSILYKFNNQSVMDFFESKGIALFEREDGKVFPRSLKAQDVLDVLVKGCEKSGLKFLYSSPVTDLLVDNSSDLSANEATNILINDLKDISEPIYTVCCNNSKFFTKKVIIATGGCSYPTTGSDGSVFSILESLGIRLESPKPALVPISVHKYPYKELSGISFSKAKISIYSNQTKVAENTDSLLLTHNSFSGPAILNISRYASISNHISVNYFPVKSFETIYRDLKDKIHRSKKLFITDLYEYFNEDLTKSPVEMPKRFLDLLFARYNIDPTEKSSQISDASLKTIVQLITNDQFVISNLGGFQIAMTTSGGVSLEDVNIKTLESKKYPNLYFAGEVLDIDGDTGGYNLQFAFSSGFLAASQ